MTDRRLPPRAEILGPCVHPRDGERGTAVRLASGAELLYVAGAMRSLPRWWRDHQPAAVDHLARVLTATAGGAS